MILITTAANDKDLIPVFGSKASPSPIPHGDFIFQGLWSEGKTISACGDRKKFLDLVACINDHRHLDQIRAAREAGFDFVFVVLEAEWRTGKDGKSAEFRRGKWRDAGIESARVHAYLLQLQYYAQVPVFQTKNKRETVELVLALETMFQKAPEDHTSLLGFHTSQPPQVSLFGRPSVMRNVLKELPGVGWELSSRVEEVAKRREDTLYEIAYWTEEDWEEVPGIGKGLSRQITEAWGWKSAMERK